MFCSVSFVESISSIFNAFVCIITFVINQCVVIEKNKSHRYKRNDTITGVSEHEIPFMISRCGISIGSSEREFPKKTVSSRHATQSRRLASPSQTKQRFRTDTASEGEREKAIDGEITLCDRDESDTNTNECTCMIKLPSCVRLCCM